MGAIAALIVAAGRSQRMTHASGPKQYREIGGQTVLARSVAAFANHPQIDAVMVVIHRDDAAAYQSAVPKHRKLLQPVFGGETRHESVRNGLEAMAAMAPGKVLIHDAARPFVTARTISEVISVADKGTGAIAACPVADTLKLAASDRRIERTLSRERVFGAQTPQGFHFDDILNAHRLAAASGKADLTDDASVAELAGIAVTLVNSPASNFKITLEADMEMAQRMIESPIVDVRTGNGYDVHALIPGDHVTLCGVRIAHDQALDGHSDADVGLHALTDALLGTIGDGDIGSHFPPSENQWKGASSDRFLAHAVALVRAAGGVVTHLDVTLICEAPKIGPHREAMRLRIAAIAGIDFKRVAVKATTNEKIGFVGRREGIAAIATATAVFSDKA